MGKSKKWDLQQMEADIVSDVCRCIVLFHVPAARIGSLEAQQQVFLGLQLTIDYNVDDMSLVVQMIGLEHLVAPRSGTQSGIFGELGSVRQEYLGRGSIMAPKMLMFLTERIGWSIGCELGRCGFFGCPLQASRYQPLVLGVQVQSLIYVYRNRYKSTPILVHLTRHHACRLA